MKANPSGGYTLAPRALPTVVRSLVEAGWSVEAEGSIYQTAGTWRMDVVSGIDWFDVTGGVEFGDMTATVPELLVALRRGESFVRLGDGSRGSSRRNGSTDTGCLRGWESPWVKGCVSKRPRWL